MFSVFGNTPVARSPHFSLPEQVGLYFFVPNRVTLDSRAAGTLDHGGRSSKWWKK